MPIITNQDNWVLPILGFWCYLFFAGGKRGKITVILLILTLALVDSTASQILKPYFGRIRPSHTITEGINLLVGKGGKFSFPSNHAANAFAMSVIVTYFHPKLKTFFYSLACLIGYSRIYVGVHYPGDVIAGAFYGYSLAWVVLSIWVMLKMRELKRGRTWVWYDSSELRP